MKNICSILILAIAFVTCNNKANNTSSTTEETPTENEPVVNDTTPKVTGIGGIFFADENPKQTSPGYPALPISAGKSGVYWQNEIRILKGFYLKGNFVIHPCKRYYLKALFTSSAKFFQLM